MKLALLILGIVSVMTWAQAKQNSKNNTVRKPAETHAGVERSNAQFETAAKFALNEGGDLSRLMSVKKRIDCVSSEYAYFEIKYGGQSSQTGIESEDPGSQILRVANKKEYDPALEKYPEDPKAYKAAVYNGSECK